MVTAIAPPTMIATIGTSNGPRLTIESTSLTRASYVPQVAKARVIFGAFIGMTEVVPFPFVLDDRISGGADRDRTGGLLVANQALSQLSYSPNSAIGFWPLALS
jgi:hypothetical protein